MQPNNTENINSLVSRIEKLDKLDLTWSQNAFKFNIHGHNKASPDAVRQLPKLVSSSGTLQGRTILVIEDQSL